MSVARRELYPISPTPPSQALPGRRKRRRLVFRPKIGAFFVIPAVIAGSLLFNVIGMVSTRLQLAAQAAALKEEVARMKFVNDKLAREVAYRKSSDYVEDEARKYGLVGPNEVQYRFAVPGNDDGAPVKRNKKIEIDN